MGRLDVTVDSRSKTKPKRQTKKTSVKAILILL